MNQEVSNYISSNKSDNSVVEDTTLLNCYLEDIAKNRRTNPTQAIEIANIALTVARKLNDKHSESRLHTYIGGISLQKGNLDLGKKHLFEALKIYNHHLNDVDLLARIKLGIGSYYFDVNDFENSLTHFFEVLQFDISDLKSATYNNIASVYLRLNQYDEAFEYLFEGLKISEGEEDYDRQIFFLYNIGSAYHFQKEYLSAIDYYHLTTATIDKINGYQYMQCLCLSRIGIVNGDLGNYKAGFKYFDKALEVSKKHSLNREQVRLLRQIGEAKLKVKDEKAFFDYHDLSIKQAKKFDLPQEILSSYQNLKQYYKENRNFSKAFAYAELIIELQKQTFTKERDNKVADIAKEKKHEIELLAQKNQYIEEQNAVLARTNSMLEEFAYVVAHDLKEPLRSILSFITLLHRRNQYQLDSQSKVYMDYITKSAKHMNALLVDLLEYTTIDKTEIVREQIDLNNLIGEVQFLLSATIEQTKSVITHDKLPIINANQTHIKQLFQQLIHNAIKFRKDSQPSTITIFAKRTNTHYTFSVSDNGIGINEKYQKKIFKIFNRLDKKNYQGTGIGLAICHKIVQLYGGKIWVESKINEGATFHFTIEHS
ncbi:MAG: ATP-binding protein [Saprospiraceae bacterium]